MIVRVHGASVVDGASPAAYRHPVHTMHTTHKSHTSHTGEEDR